MTPIDSTYDKNICVKLFKAMFTHQRSKYTSKKNFETALSSQLYQKYFQNLEGRDLNLLVNESFQKMEYTYNNIILNAYKF